MDQMFQPTQKSSEQLPPTIGPGEALPQIVQSEQASAPEKREHQHLGNAGAAVQQAYSDDTATVATPLTKDDASAALQTSQMQLAGTDVDVIEKEWVLKAKSIVLKTKDDPREQSSELTGMKREYKEKRFGKSLLDNRAA